MIHDLVIRPSADLGLLAGQILQNLSDAHSRSPLIRLAARNLTNSGRTPESDLFSYLLLWGSLVLGSAMFLGALVRPVGWAIAFLMLNVYYAGPVHYRELVIFLAICAVACAVSRAGRRVGFDELLDERFPAWMTWVRG